MKTTVKNEQKIDFFERNQKIKDNLLKVYIVTLAISAIFIAVKGFI